ncbi:MAG: helix-turn-helix domain-containing protein [Thermoguttaceae bacterium]
MTNATTRWNVIILDKAKQRPRRFAALQPEVVSSSNRIAAYVEHAPANSLWISYEKDLTNALIRSVSLARHSRPLGSVLLLYRPVQETLPTLTGCFKTFVYSVNGGFLPPEELAEALFAENKSYIFIGGTVDSENEVVTLWRGDLKSLAVPFRAFASSGDGVEPDFKAFSVMDYGHTVRLGEYEAAADAILYEFDSDYRKMLSKQRLESERSFGAALRRLRKQRGVTQEDFAPLPAKTIARIEQGKVKRIRPNTLAIIANRLSVEPNAIETF